MRLATIIPENGATALAAVSVDIDHFVGLHSFLSFFGSKELGVLRTRVIARNAKKMSIQGETRSLPAFQISG
jgi:hypothetical protein